MKKIFLVLLVFLLAACSPTERESETVKAETIMRDFFSVLANSQYAEAVKLYGGDYEVLAEWNSDISPTDHESLWQRGCEQNGLVCMEVMEVVNAIETESGFDFTVTFKTKGGELFELTGCCGEMFPEPISEYVISVQRNGDGNYQILSLPPYVP